jgi:hypothetical protein
MSGGGTIRARCLRVLLVESDEEIAADLFTALEHQCEVRCVPDAVEALVALRDQPVDIIIAEGGLAPYSTELLLSVVRRLYPHVRRVLCANLPDETAHRLREERFVHAVISRVGVDRERLAEDVLGQARPRVPTDHMDEVETHCSRLYANVTELACDAGARMLDALGARGELEWTLVKQDAARLLRASAAHALALADELERAAGTS